MINVQELKSFCSPDLEYLTIKCWPDYLPREFSLVIVTEVYSSTQANTTTALKVLGFGQTGKHISWGRIYCSWDFSKAHLKKTQPKIYQHIDCSTLAAKTLDHCYSNFRDAYKALPCSPFGKSDHDSIFLIPSYRQKLKQEVPVLRSVQRWSGQSESMLHSCFDHADWDMFLGASEKNIDIYTDWVHPNQKP